MVEVVCVFVMGGGGGGVEVEVVCGGWVWGGVLC